MFEDRGAFLLKTPNTTRPPSQQQSVASYAYARVHDYTALSFNMSPYKHVGSTAP